MAKRKTKRKQPSLTEKYQPKRKSNWARWAIIGLLGLALISFILMSIPRAKPTTGPRFTDEGDLTIYQSASAEVIAQLDIEIADDEESIVQGLMYRDKMEENQGMLFLMPSVKPQAFWMLNTYISLDIIFIGADKRIVKIRENTVPRSTDQVTSVAPAAYVLEVNAGYAQRHGLKEGDRVEW
ncbi:MAG: DUF192 domain-containing protein [Bacteroidota bacterium]